MIDSTTYVDAVQELVERCKEGDKKSFEQLYHLFSKQMFSICVRIVNDRHEAEDVLQESFFTAFHKLNQFKGKSTFGSWLKRIVLNKSIDTVKKRQKSIITYDDAEVSEEERYEDVKQEEITYDPEVINWAIQQLPDGYRIIVTLFLFENYSHKMIAERLNITEGTSKSQFSRGRQRLAMLIKQKQQSHE